MSLCVVGIEIEGLFGEYGSEVAMFESAVWFGVVGLVRLNV